MKLKSNFSQDWCEHLKKVLVNHWGYNLSDIDDNNIALDYFNAKHRRVEKKPRKLEISDAFHCPYKYQSRWNKFQNDVVIGNDITPHLSTKISNIDYKDSMLNDWGIFHFHLGTKLDGDFIERTGPLLFALVTDDYLYAVNIYSHGHWTNSEIIEVIHKNWPMLIRQYLIHGIKEEKGYNYLERKTLRKKNVNATIHLHDGTIRGDREGCIGCFFTMILSIWSSIVLSFIGIVILGLSKLVKSRRPR